MTTPLEARDQQRLRWASTAALATNVLIVFSGGLVRVTGSGLGCPTWPRCDEESFVPTPGGAHAGWQTAIEFGNRMLTFVVLAAAVAVVWELRRHRAAHPRALVRLAWLLPAGVLAQAIMGGITVLLGLTPWTVAMHFLLSMVLIAVAVIVFEWVRRPPGAVLPGAGLRWATWVLAAVGFVVLVLGTLVTGAGPHAGDPSTPRLAADIRILALLHADAVWLFVGLTVALVAVTWQGPARLRTTVRALLGLQLLQGTIGYTQYATGIPEALVAVHILGAALVWMTTVFVWVRARPLPGTDDGAHPTAGETSADPRPTPQVTD
jgi:heme a synthase